MQRLEEKIQQRIILNSDPLNIYRFIENKSSDEIFWDSENFFKQLLEKNDFVINLVIAKFVFEKEIVGSLVTFLRHVLRHLHDR